MNCPESISKGGERSLTCRAELNSYDNSAFIVPLALKIPIAKYYFVPQTYNDNSARKHNYYLIFYTFLNIFISILSEMVHEASGVAPFVFSCKKHVAEMYARHVFSLSKCNLK